MCHFVKVILVKTKNATSWSRIVLRDHAAKMHNVDYKTPINIMLLYNPTDPNPQQCEVTVCANCRGLRSTEITNYNTVIWKLPMTFNVKSQKFPAGIASASTMSETVTISTIEKAQLHSLKIEQNQVKSYHSKYPTITIDAPKGISTYEKYDISGHLSLHSQSSYKVYIPYTKSNGPKFIILSETLENYAISGGFQTHPMLLHVSHNKQTLYTITTQSDRHFNCLDGATVVIKEAIISKCPQDMSKNIPYITTVFNLTEGLDIVLQPGYRSCFVTMQIHQKKEVASHCELLLKYQNNIMWFSGYWLSSNKEKSFALLSMKLKTYRYVFLKG